MNLTPRQRLTQFDHLFQTELFPQVEQEVGALSESARLLVAALGMVSLTPWLPRVRPGAGRPPRHRQALASAFLAKAVLNLTSTRDLLERLHSDEQLRRICGWRRAQDIPHEATFSRAFAAFAACELPQHVHETLIRTTQQDRLIGHIARDATAIEARERYPKDPPAKAVRRKYKRGPKAKRNMPRAPRTRMQEQRTESIAEMLAKLPRHCSLGVKTSSKGYRQYWRGYKLHLDVADGQIPITAILTGACVHDSQVAIPLMSITSQRVSYLYDLMDAGYDAEPIRRHSQMLGHRAISELVTRYKHTARRVPLRKNSRRYKTVYEREPILRELTWAEQDRMRERTMVERVYGRLKDEFGGRNIRVRGAAKIMAHLMFGVLALTVDQLLRLCP
jgi:Transposase DDE domain/Transposase domain (DUF772)